VSWFWTRRTRWNRWCRVLAGGSCGSARPQSGGRGPAAGGLADLVADLLCAAVVQPLDPGVEVVPFKRVVLRLLVGVDSTPSCMVSSLRCTRISSNAPGPLTSRSIGLLSRDGIPASRLEQLSETAQTGMPIASNLKSEVPDALNRFLISPPCALRSRIACCCTCVRPGSATAPTCKSDVRDSQLALM
jgi:hypothetical protein